MLSKKNLIEPLILLVVDNWGLMGDTLSRRHSVVTWRKKKSQRGAEFKSKQTNKKIKRVLTEAVSKIILEISDDRSSAVFQNTSFCSFASSEVGQSKRILEQGLLPREVSLESSRAGVLDADHVRVIRPDIFEKVLKVLLVLNPDILSQNSQPSVQ